MIALALRHWSAILVAAVAAAFLFVSGRADQAERKTLRSEIAGIAGAQAESEKTITILKAEAVRRDVVLAGMRAQRVRDRKELEDAIVAAAAAKGTARDGPLAPVTKEYLRRLRGPDR
ncbi:hypothetical protein [Aureimonas sp. AU40]|uniref:hypothetical protein n=1 Tax=Aureimonas sp. AU40 TaxID=1637747 RepID=UPI0007840001|nr:hypothetical protein [Aureimonas sp. AU40]